MDTLDNLVIRSIAGDLRQGGTLVTGQVNGDTDLLQYGDNVRLLGRSLADFDDMEYRQIFNGHVLETPDYTFDALTSQAAIRLGTANYLMRGQIQDVAFTEQASPANDHQIAPTMRLSDCFDHLVSAHCNFVYNATSTPEGIIFSTDYDTSDTALSRFNFHKNNTMWPALAQQLGGGDEGGVQFFWPYLRRDNELVYQAAPHFRSPAPDSKGTLTKEHLRGRVRVQVRNARAEDKIGQVQLIAVGGDNTYYESSYPTDPADGKIYEKKSGIWADSQARTDTLAQNLYEWLTRPYTLTVQVDPGLILFGDDGAGLDLGDKLDITYDGPAEDAITGAGVHLDLSAEAFFVYKYSVTYDARGKTARGTLELEADN
jgi:hypothetical protein